MKARGNRDELLLKVPEEDTAVRLGVAAVVAELLEWYKDKQYHSLEEKIFSDWPVWMWQAEGSSKPTFHLKITFYGVDMCDKSKTR